MRIAVVGDGIAAHLAAVMLAWVGTVVRVPAGAGGHGLGPVGAAVIGSPGWCATDIAGAIGDVPGALPSLGIAFAGWSRDPWFLPFGDTGAPLDGVPFAQVAARWRADGQAVRLGDFALAAMAAQAGRFAAPVADPRSPLSALRPGVVYPAAALSQRLEAMAAQAGVAVAASFTDADLVVDASGGAAGISPGTWESWRAWLPCNRVASRTVRDDRAPALHPAHTATPQGWRSVVALNGAAAETHYSTDGAGDRYDNGLRRVAWSGRYVAIGAAAGIVEPLFGDALHLAQEDVTRLIGLLPAAGSNGRAEAAEYGRLTAQRYERARDTAVALWITAGRPAAEPSPELTRKLALYRHRGYLPLEDGDAWSRDDWAVLLDGQGVRQRHLDPLAAALPSAATRAHGARLRERLVAAVAAMRPLERSSR